MWFRKLFKATGPSQGTAPRTGLVTAALDTTPDTPEGFGFKCNWFVVQSQEPAQVVQALGLQKVQPANWASGIAKAYEGTDLVSGESFVFVSPPVQGWVLVVGATLPYPDMRERGRNESIDAQYHAMVADLLECSNEVQFFGTNRLVGFEAWALMKRGQPARVFAYADGSVYANLGPQSAAESALGFPDLTGLSPEVATDKLFSLAEPPEISTNSASSLSTSLTAVAAVPHRKHGPLPAESDATTIAGYWSIDPTHIDELALTPSTGLLAVLLA